VPVRKAPRASNVDEDVPGAYFGRMAYYARRSTGLGAGYLTVGIIAVNILVFLFSQVDRSGSVGYLALYPSYVLQSNAWWQVVTYMFVHTAWRHIFGNMLALFIFGTQVEARMRSGDFLAFYFVCGIGAGLVTLVVNTAAGIGNVPVIGASGAVFGLMLAFAAFFPEDRIYLFGLLPLKARTLVLGYAAIEIFLQLTNLQSGVAHIAHLSGLLFAWLYLLLRWKVNAFAVLFRRQ
jgi:membrane associated rhomboid family serine protease